MALTDAALGVTRYAYGPFGMLSAVTDPGGAVTRTTRVAFGRVRQLDEPDRGTPLLSHDGFGELMSSTDWTWDTAANGIADPVILLLSPRPAELNLVEARRMPLRRSAPIGSP